MSDERYRKKLIKDFLEEVEEKLPFWLKDNQDELKEVLKELEEHIEDKVEALEETGKTNLEATQVAITQMGSPSTIAREYKRRGTPKLYITEELFPMYLTVLKYAGLALGLIIAISTAISVVVLGLTGGEWWASIFQGLQGLAIWSIVVAAGITAVFTWLSYEGFFEEDLKKVFKSKEQREAEARLPPKVIVKTPTAEKPEKKYPKKLEKPHELIIGGIFAVVFGTLAVGQPVSTLNALINPVFLELLLAIGITWILLGFFGIIHGAFVSWSINGNRAFYPIRAIINFASLPIIVLFLVNPQIFPIIIWSESTGFVVYQIAVEFYWIYYVVLSLITIGTLVSGVQKIYKAVTLQEEDFFPSGFA